MSLSEFEDYFKGGMAIFLLCSVSVLMLSLAITKLKNIRINGDKDD